MTGLEATVLFTDIEGSTERWERYPEAMRTALERHDRELRSCFTTSRARIVKHTGDGMVVAADDPSELLAAAVDAQRRLAAIDWSDVDGLKVRMGMHHGWFHARDGDLFGSDMNLAARIMGGAAGGQIVASEATVQQITLPAGCRAEDLGRFRFRGVQDPVVVLAVHYPGAPETFPAYRSSEDGLGNLAAPLARLVGRDEEVQHLSDLVRTPGIVTVVGPGGVGKTSIALAVAAGARPAFPDGLWFADLTTVGSAGDVLPFLARVLRIERPEEGSFDQSLAHVLLTRSLLLVVDNCEHLIDEVRAALQAIVGAHPKATILATSQESLGHPAERVVSLAPLDLRDPQSAAVGLFIERARQLDPSYAPDQAERDEILDLCRKLDGLPLAIELAASRTAALGLKEIVSHLGERFRLLEGPGATRHDALERTIAWSHDLLDGGDQAVLRRVSVFEGEFDLAQAAAAAGLDHLSAADAVARLVSKSMSTRAPTTTSPSFRLLESVRHFALARLDEAEERWATLERVTARVVALGHEARSSVDGPDQLAWFDRMDREMPSIRIAIEHLIGSDPTGALLLLVELYQYWMARGSRQEALRWLGAAADRAVDADPGLVSRALADAAALAYFCGDLTRSRDLSERSIVVSERHGLAARPTALLRLAALQLFEGDVEAGTASGAQALETMAAEHDPPEPPETLAAIGALLALAGQAPRAVEVCEQAIASHTAPSPTTLASDLVNLAYAYRLFDNERAVEAYRAAWERATAAGSRFYAATAAMGAGLSLRAAGRADEALAVLAEALPMARDLGMRDEVLVMLKAASRVLRSRGSVDGDLVFLVAEREQRARQWEGGPTLGRRPPRSPTDLAAEIGDGYGELAAAAAETDVDDAIALIERVANHGRGPTAS